MKETFEHDTNHQAFEGYPEYNSPHNPRMITICMHTPRFHPLIRQVTSVLAGGTQTGSIPGFGCAHDKK